MYYIWVENDIGAKKVENNFPQKFLYSSFWNGWKEVRCFLKNGARYNLQALDFEPLWGGQLDGKFIMIDKDVVRGLCFYDFSGTFL